MDERERQLRALQLDRQAEDLAGVAQRLRTLAEEVGDPLRRVDQLLDGRVWQGRAAVQARGALDLRLDQTHDLARRLDALAAVVERQAQMLTAEARQLRRPRTN